MKIGDGDLPSSQHSFGKLGSLVAHLYGMLSLRCNRTWPCRVPFRVNATSGGDRPPLGMMVFELLMFIMGVKLMLKFV
jgi:hypothetical protein